MKLSIVGDAYVLTSDLTATGIETAKKYRPNALKIKDADGNDIFAISYNPGKPCISKNGVTFGGVSRNGDGKATITGTIPDSVTDAKAFVAELVGCAVSNLKVLEDSLPPVLATIEAERNALLNSITIA